MIFSETPLAGAWLIDPEPFGDERGTFARTFCRREFAEHGIETEFPQANVSCNPRVGTLRGIHFQLPPHEEGKLVRCSRGRIFDAIVDLRPSSTTLAQSFAIELSAANGRQLYIPKGFGHGLLTLEPESEVSYLMSEYYAPSAVGGYRYDDPTFAITWPSEVEVISKKDTGLSQFDRAGHEQLIRDAHNP